MIDRCSLQLCVDTLSVASSQPDFVDVIYNPIKFKLEIVNELI